MKNKVYIIGKVPNIIDSNCEAKFYKVHMRLLQMGYDVINPIERLTNRNILPEDAKRRNLQDLMFANVAYIMPCTDLGKEVKNLEIKLALDFNITIVLGTIDLNDDVLVDTKIKARGKRKKNQSINFNQANNIFLGAKIG